jgi:phosphopantetheinyl transferase (holo-ACP synthase)
MDFPIEKCTVAGQHFSTPKLQELLQYPHLLTCALLDLQLLEEKVNKLGEERVMSCSLSSEELNLLSKFASPKRKREWLGGRLAAKSAAARLLEQVESQKNVMHWSSITILADKNGRPFLSANKENLTLPVDISISHSKSMAAAMAVNKGYCGIDIQKISPRVIKVIDRFCTQNEMDILRKFFPVEPEKQAGPLTKLWAAKETLRKASCMSSLPGFLKLELIEITATPLEMEPDSWGFVFNWKNPDGLIHKKCTVAVTQIADYALALTARDDTVG